MIHNLHHLPLHQSHADQVATLQISYLKYHHNSDLGDKVVYTHLDKMDRSWPPEHVLGLRKIK
jgi:hypothetical protein